MDTLEHIFFNCLAWREPRNIFETTGQLSSLRDLIRHIVTSPASWDAFNEFANAVISTKEESDRIEEQEEQEELLRSSQRSVIVNLVDGDSDLD